MTSKILTLIIAVALISCEIKDENNSSTPAFEVSEITINNIPEIINIEGDLLTAKSWMDKNGENLLVVYRKMSKNDAEDEKSVELFGEQYLIQGDSLKLLWDIYDFERNCMFDLWIGLLPNSTRITDLDNDGISETTLLYKLTCRSDITPSRMKLLMHEGNKKMALRGNMILKQDSEKLNQGFEPDLSKADTTGLSEYEQYMELYGRYENSNDFDGMPSEFLEHARSLWLEFVNQDEFLQL